MRWKPKAIPSCGSRLCRLLPGNTKDKSGRTARPLTSRIPWRVALTVRHVFGVDDETALVAALLHDLIKDTTTDYDDLLKAFGQAVAEAVAALTKDARLPEAEREAAYDHQLAAASWQARLVKLADVYDNFCDARDEKERAKFAEKAERAIHCAGDAAELQRAMEIVRRLIAGDSCQTAK